MVRIYNEKPSKLLGISDTYTAFCLDEACAYIINKLDNKEQPKFRTSYSKPSDLYKKYK
nr:MAG TPA: hypothetical protein [Caudoviricetes sp.]